MPNTYKLPPDERRHEPNGQNPKEIERRFEAGTARMDRLEALIQTNTTDTAEILEILRLGKSFFKVIGYLGQAIKWASPVVVSCAAFYYALKGQK